MSYSALELDLPSSAILNRGSNPPRKIHHDFIEKLLPETVERGKLVRSVKELWDDERRRRTARGESGPYDLQDTAPREFDTRDPKDPIWRSEGRLREKVEDRAHDDLKKYREQVGPRGKGAPEFGSYVEEQEKMQGRKTHWIDRIKTTFEQVDAIYISRFEQDERETYEFGAWAVKGIGTATREEEKAWEQEINVNMSRLLVTQSEEKRRKALERAEKAKNGSLEVDSDVERDPDEEDEEAEDEANAPEARYNDRLPTQPPPATQSEALRRDRARADRLELRGREGSVEEGEWDKEPSDDDEAQMKYWGLRDADTASERAQSELFSPASARSTASSPLKPASFRSPSSSPIKRSRLGVAREEAEEELQPAKRRKEEELGTPARNRCDYLPQNHFRCSII